MPVKRRADRPAQRRRTRKAIVDATMALLARGGKPSVEEVAAAADVSRRTVYLYFPTFDQLLIDATVGALSQTSVDRAIDAGREDDAGDDVPKRVERMVRALHDERLPADDHRQRVHNAAPPRRAEASTPGRQGRFDPFHASIATSRYVPLS